MDDFVCGKLTEWGLENYIPVFKENQVVEESFLCLQEDDIKDLIKQIGPKAIFRKYLDKFKGTSSDTSNRGKRKMDQSEPEQQLEPSGSFHREGRMSPSLKKRCLVSPTVISQEFRETLEPEEKELDREFDKTKDWKSSPLCEEMMPPTQEKMPPAEEMIPPAEEKIPPAENKMPPTQEKMPPAEEMMPPAEEMMPPAEENMPTGVDRACTPVITEVEASAEDVEEVKIISEKELEELVWSTQLDFEKMTALFGDWVGDSYETFMEKYKKISKAIQETKTLASDLGDPVEA